MGFSSFISQNIKLLLLKMLYFKNDNGKKTPVCTDFPWNDHQFSKDKEVIFSHGGGIGDLLFSLYFCREIAEHFGESAINYHILTNTYDSQTKTGYNRGLPREVTDFLLPLLKK